MKTAFKNKFFSIIEKNGAIISVIKNDNKSIADFAGGINGIRNAHYQTMLALYPEIEHPHLARFLSGCTPYVTRYVIQLAD
jgi:hypothetical protein